MLKPKSILKRRKSIANRSGRMSNKDNPFQIVRRWWGNKPVESDTMRDGVDPSTKEGAFECLILAHLYSINDVGPDVKKTLDALREEGFTKINRLARFDDKSPERQRIREIWRQYYFNGRYPQKIDFIVENASIIQKDGKLQGDLRRLLSICDGDSHEILQWLWKLPGIKKKTFWVMREMRMRGVWDVEGRYCCVPDVQVGSSLDRWFKIEKWTNSLNFNLLLRCSQIVWDYFGELYDLPILHYSQEFKCNDIRLRNCHGCEIVQCKPRQESNSSDISLVKVEDTKHCIECGIQIPRKAKYCPDCGKYQF
jgi:hypothetical protein